MPNSLLDPWRGPAGGLPAFDRVRIGDVSTALDVAIAEYRRDLAKIVDDPAPPTFANVHEALENAGEGLDRVLTYYRVWTSTLKDAEVRTLEAAVEPRLAGLADEFVQNDGLFRKIEAVYAASAGSDLTPEQKRVCWVRHLNFELRGAALTPEQKFRVAEINQRLATLGTQFDENVLSDEDVPALICTSERQLAGMSPSFVAAARAEAERRGLGDRWVVSNTRSSAEPFLTFARDRAARETVFRAWTTRGERTNYPVARETIALRAERARLYGFTTHAHWKLADKMIKDPAAAMDLMMGVWAPAKAQVRRDVTAMQAIIDAEGDGERFALAPWDYRYYAEKVRQRRYDLNLDLVRPYMRFENVRDAMFAVAGKLYDLTFTPLGGVPVYHPDVTVFEVTRAGKTFGVFYLDPFARPGKSSGAWMSNYRTQAAPNGVRRIPIVSNNSSFIRAAAGEPTLLSWDDARTMFHEFGHALHGLNSDVTYAAVQGTAVPTDYVEFPSHFNENFLSTPEVLAHFVDANGEALPSDLIEKLKRTQTFNAAFGTVEFLAAAIVDMRLHLATGDVDPERLTEQVLTELGMPSEIVMRHRLPHFAHSIASDAYSAGYYSYLWSDVIASDAFEAFIETGDAFDPETARRLREHVLAVGNSVDPATGYRAFRGRDAGVAALLRARGLTDEVSP